MADGDRWTSKWRPPGSADNRNDVGAREPGANLGGGDAWSRNQPSRGGGRSGPAGGDTTWQRWRGSASSGDQRHSSGNGRGSGSGSGSSYGRQAADRPQEPRWQQHQSQGQSQGQGEGRGHGRGREDAGPAPMDARAEEADDAAAVDMLQLEFEGLGLGDGFGFGGSAAQSSAGRQQESAWPAGAEAAEGSAGGGHSAGPHTALDEDAGLRDLEAAVASGDVVGWSLEQLGRAAVSLTEAWDTRARPAMPGSGWHRHPFHTCYSPREAALVKSIAAAAICAAASVSTPVQQHLPQQQPPQAAAQAVARLLRMCARGPYWGGPGEAAVAEAWQRRGGAAATTASSLADKSAWPSLSRAEPAAGEPAATSVPASRTGTSEGVETGASSSSSSQPSQSLPAQQQGQRPRYAALGQAMVAALAADDCRVLAELDSQHAAHVAWSLSRAGVLGSLAGDFDVSTSSSSSSLSAGGRSAGSVSYALKLQASLDEAGGCGRAEAAAAAATLAAAPAALLQALRERCRALMAGATVPELCGMCFAAADAAALPVAARGGASSTSGNRPPYGRGAAAPSAQQQQEPHRAAAAAAAAAAGAGGGGRLLGDLAADALQMAASRLEEAVVLGLESAAPAGGKVFWTSSLPRMHTFLPRELACVAFSAGRLGLGAERLGLLLAALSSYLVATRRRLPWNASTLGVFVCGVSKLVGVVRTSSAYPTRSNGDGNGSGNSTHGSQQQQAQQQQELRRSCAQLLDAVEATVLGMRQEDLDPRSVSFLLSYMGRLLGTLPRDVESHLLGSLLLHSSADLEPRNACHLLFGLHMAFDGGEARDDPMLAHLCAALSVAHVRRLAPADLCMAVTSLARLHGGKVLANQVPEVLAALENIAQGVARRGFGAGSGEHDWAAVHVPDYTAVPFTCREVSNFVVAMGQLKFYSPGVLAALRDHAAAGGLDRASSWDTSALLYGLAWLNYDWRDGLVVKEGSGGRQNGCGGGGGGGGGEGGSAAAAPPPADSPALALDLVGLLADVVVRRGRGASSQDLTNALWGLAVMEGALDRYRGAVTALVAEANARGPHNCHPREMKQVWPVERELRALLPAPYTRFSDDMVRAGRLNSSESDHTFSRVQAEVNRVITAMHTSGLWPGLRDLQFEQELVPGGALLMKIDVQVIVARPGGVLARLALEFDGPFHFMVNDPYCWRREDGRTALRNRVLARHLGGPEHVVVVNMEEWVAASREENRGMPGRWRLLADKLGLGEPVGRCAWSEQ
ncbi:hypothetical protein HYH02_009465 [Chlamydomonas schloesseri]|uniref:RAP domain-containing protein n=1 Tax=Chlamydomonas schloesseri TaxID=2026947 RepID=A0A835W838_9CHLO|nr:hypothetical protein HYH02_009465 [Chlamydomonas schloesseri]|eukprot:KAG2443050.1 hypothetical protein HYH02_009465 [Chlamydomonas schloesseri]